MEEFFKDIEGYEGLYQVSNLGRVKSLIYRGIKRDKVLKAGVDTQGYLSVNLYKSGKCKSKNVHRLVALAFVPNPDKKAQVNHINALKEDNCVNNIEWSTPSENIRHAINKGLMNNQRKRTKDSQSIPVINTKTGVIYESIKTASKANSISKSYLSQILRNNHLNRTCLKYYTQINND
jgi:hypothetical protein